MPVKRKINRESREPQDFYVFWGDCWGFLCFSKAFLRGILRTLQGIKIKRESLQLPSTKKGSSYKKALFAPGQKGLFYRSTLFLFEGSCRVPFLGSPKGLARLSYSRGVKLGGRGKERGCKKLLSSGAIALF